MTKRIIQRINTILKHIDTINSDIKGLSLEEFKQSDLLTRATVFSLSQIGEHMGKIEVQLQDVYTDLPWREAKDFRNLIVHDYGRVKAEVTYETVKKDLPELKKNLLKVKADLEKQL